MPASNEDDNGDAIHTQGRVDTKDIIALRSGDDGDKGAGAT